MDDDKIFEDYMSRAYLGQAFREFYKQSLCQLKYEVHYGNIRLLYYATNRGRQRYLEKKKYKTIGEIASLTQILQIMEENAKGLASKNEVFASAYGETLYSKQAAPRANVELTATESGV